VNDSEGTPLRVGQVVEHEGEHGDIVRLEPGSEMALVRFDVVRGMVHGGGQPSGTQIAQSRGERWVPGRELRVTYSP
jgi:hypothetical protein